MAALSQHTSIIIFVVLVVLGVIAGIFVFRGLSASTEFGTEICDLKDNDGDGEIDEGFAVTCSTDSECGPSGNYGERYCKDNQVYQGLYNSECTGKKGTCLSECVSGQTEELIQNCPNECASGVCV